MPLGGPRCLSWFGSPILHTCRCLGDGRVVNPIASSSVNRRRWMSGRIPRRSSGDVILAGTNETNDASNWISVTATEEPRDDGSEDPEESHPDSNSVSEGYDTSHTTMTLDLDLAEESSERMNLNSPSTPSLKNIDPNDLDSFATLNVEDAKQLESVYRGIERQLPEPEDDAGIEDFFIYSNDVAPHAFIVSSQRLLDGQVIVQSLELDWVVDISSMAGGEIHRGEIYRLWLWWRRRWGAERRRATVIWLLAAAFVVLLLAAGSRVGDNALSEPAVHPSSAPALVELTLVHDAEAKGALCLDGSPAAYHLTKGFGSGSDKWIVHLEGGGWCLSLDSCSYRKSTLLGSSNYMERQISFVGILSSIPSQNPGKYWALKEWVNLMNICVFNQHYFFIFMFVTSYMQDNPLF
ncbi:uncharacterized protein LOC122013690 [Zingiber officinale]|uniref:uncharacterized protein LOC122013690 n=1 Tax=Zingiber officinale TaxID=94328 RepID=UPI001C4A79C3|nr:uncharacterized protein LOC122013690 [Zingiber officinale]